MSDHEHEWTPAGLGPVVCVTCQELRCSYRLADAWTCITHGGFWHPEEQRCRASNEPADVSTGSEAAATARGLATAGVYGGNVAHDNPVADMEHDMSLACWCQPTVQEDDEGWIVTHRRLIA